MSFCHLVGGKKMLVCQCDNCKKTNYTCITDGACLVVLDRYRNEEIRHYKSCTKMGKGSRFTCENPPTVDHILSCCYRNMCNADIHLTFPPTTTTLTSNIDEGNFINL